MSDNNFINTFQPDDANRQTHILHRIMFSLGSSTAQREQRKEKRLFKNSLWNAPPSCNLRPEKHVFCCNQWGLRIRTEPWWIAARTPSTSRTSFRRPPAGAAPQTSVARLSHVTETPRSNFPAVAKATKVEKRKINSSFQQFTDRPTLLFMCQRTRFISVLNVNAAFLMIHFWFLCVYSFFGFDFIFSILCAYVVFFPPFV